MNDVNRAALTYVRSPFSAPISLNIFGLCFCHKHQRLGKNIINTNDVAIMIDPISIPFSCHAMDRSVSLFGPVC